MTRRPTAPDVGPARATRAGLVLAALPVLVLAAGVAFRAWTLFGPLRPIDSDEAVVGLMARELLEGEVSTFYWGQAYGGSLEVVLLAPVLAVFPGSLLALRSTALLAGVVAALLAWRIARRWLDPDQARFVGAVTFAWPPLHAWFGSRQMLFYAPTVALGLAVLLLVIRIQGGRRPAPTWFAVGLLTGSGWWLSPNIAYFAVPAAVYLLATGPWSRLRWSPLGLAGGVLGALPWLWANLRTGFASLEVEDAFVEGTVPSRLEVWLIEGFGVIAGARLPITLRWVGPPGLGPVLAVVLGVATLVAAVVSIRRRQPWGYGLVAAPFIFAVNPLTTTIGNGRYLFFAAALLGPLLASVATAPVLRVVLAAWVVVSLGLFVRAGDELAPAYQPDVAELVAVLEDEGIDALYTDYWTAYGVTFLTDRSIVAASFGPRRFAAYERDVRADPDAAYALPTGSALEISVRQALEERSIPYDAREVAAWILVEPVVNVPPEVLVDIPAVVGPDGS